MKKIIVEVSKDKYKELKARNSESITNYFEYIVYTGREILYMENYSETKKIVVEVSEDRYEELKARNESITNYFEYIVYMGKELPNDDTGKIDTTIEVDTTINKVYHLAKKLHEENAINSYLWYAILEMKDSHIKEIDFGERSDYFKEESETERMCGSK